jgi:small-conductance mechanosensitive channel
MPAVLNVTTLIAEYFTPERVSLAIRVFLILLIGIPLIRLIRSLTRKLVKDRLSAQSELLLVRSVYYSGLLIILITLLNEFGFKLSALLGAAGVFGIAIGFASQTSFANIISGVFLISEKPFMIGDWVQIGSTTGMVDSIDLLSIKLKTSDNRFVRVPNETMIKTEVINITRFPVRRANISISISYNEDLKRVRQALMEVAESEPLALKEPAPVFLTESFADYGINLVFGVWGNKDDVVDLRTALMMAISEKFKKENIETPYPHLTWLNSG